MKRCLGIIMIFLIYQAAFSDSSLPTLLFGYLRNDLSLQKYMLMVQSKALDYDSSKISNGIDLTLSSGTVRIQSSSNGARYTFTPSASLALPELHDTTLSASLPLTKKSGFAASSENGTFLDSGSVKVSAGIITAAPLKRKIALLEAERAYTEAKRNAWNQALIVENEFYTNLKSLYSYAAGVLTAKKELYDDEIDLRVLEVQGYSKTSASYRKKYLECQSDRRDVSEALRKLERETAIFAVRCGAEYVQVFDPANFDVSRAEEIGEQAFDSVMNFLPKEVPTTDMIDARDFEPDSYTKTENARWTKYIGDLRRGSDYTLEVGAYASYTFNDSISKYDTVDGGLTFDWRGISASAGVSVPTGGNALPLDSSTSGQSSKSPVYTFSLTLTPNTWRLASINKKQDALNEKIDEISIESASDDYETDILDRLSKRGDLRWAEHSYAEEYDMYSQLEYDMDKWLSQGIVTKSDYLDAANSRDKAQMNILINAVEKIIYNNEVKMLFVREK